MQGYASPEYQQVYAKYGEISGPGYINRQIPGTDFIDRISVYPFMPVRLDEYFIYFNPRKSISDFIITDPLKDDYISEKDLWRMKNRGFQGTVTKEKYKDHAVVKLKDFDENKLPENHKRNIKKSVAEGTSIQICRNLFKHTDMFDFTYKTLKERHKIADNAWTNYSKEQLDQLLKVPGAVLFRADHNMLAGYDLFYIQSDCVYYHIGCLSNRGYEVRANFLMMFEAIKFFKSLGLDRLEIGSVPDGASGDGLRRFKMGFANMSLPNYVYKIVHNKEVYEELSKGRDNSFFPNYRGPLV